MAGLMARTFAILLLLAFLTAGCADNDDDGDSDTDTTTTTSGGTTVSASGSVTFTGTGAPSNNTVNVKVLDDRYDDNEITIKRGDTVNWTATGTTHPHSVTSRVAGLFDSSPACTAATPSECMENGDDFEHEFDLTVGEYEYYCRIHSSMTGKVVITN